MPWSLKKAPDTKSTGPRGFLGPVADTSRATGSYSFRFVVRAQHELLPPDPRPAEQILRSRANRDAALDRYTSAVRLHRADVAYNRALHAHLTGQLTALNPRSPFGHDPGGLSAQFALSLAQRPQFWPTLSSGMTVPLARLYDWHDKFEHLNLADDTFLNYGAQLGYIEQSIQLWNKPDRWLSSPGKQAYREELGRYVRDIRVTTAYRFNDIIHGFGAYFALRFVQDPTLGHLQALQFIFPENDEERLLWREHVFAIPRPQRATEAGPSTEARLLSAPTDPDPPSYDQVWKRG